MICIAESTRAERAAVITFALVNGKRIRAREAAERLGVSVRTMQRDLDEISRVVPIVQDDEHFWFWLPSAEMISPL